MSRLRTTSRIDWVGGLAIVLLSVGCGDDSSADGSTTGTATGSTSPSGGPTGTSASVTDSTPPDGSSSDGGGADTSTSSVADSTGSTGEPGTESGSESGGVSFPCEDPALPVMVVGGGAYETVQAAVDATPEGGTVQICPGEYPETIQIVRDVTIQGAGMNEVTIIGPPGEQVIDSSNASLDFSDFTVRGGQVGIWAGNADDHSVTLTRVSIEDMEQYGLYVWASGNESIETTLVDLVESNISGIEAPGDGAGILFQRLTATLTDTTIIDNRAVGIGGGLRIDTSQVTVTGGQVHANEASRGGGALLESGIVAATLTVIASDWGAGMAVENYEADVRCYPNIGGFPVPIAGFLGVAADAECTSEGLGADCCLP